MRAETEVKPVPIIVSEISRQETQVDGSAHVWERHTDHAGQYHHAHSIMPAGTDLAARLAQNASLINDTLKLAELEYAIFSAPWDYVLIEASNNELAIYVRELYRKSSADVLARVARRVLEWIANGRYTDTQVRTAYGLSAPQWTTLKNKMQTLAVSVSAIDAAVGE